LKNKVITNFCQLISQRNIHTPKGIILCYLVAKSPKCATKKNILLSEISLSQIKRHKIACVTSKNDKSQTAISKTEMAVSKILLKLVAKHFV
jgi:hypothetical protein